MMEALQLAAVQCHGRSVCWWVGRWGVLQSIISQGAPVLETCGIGLCLCVGMCVCSS